MQIKYLRCLRSIIPRIHFAHFANVITSGKDVENAIVRLRIIALRKSRREINLHQVNTHS